MRAPKLIFKVFRTAKRVLGRQIDNQSFSKTGIRAPKSTFKVFQYRKTGTPTPKGVTGIQN